MGPDPANPLSAPLTDFQKDLDINTVGAYAAAKAAVSGFGKLSSDAKKTFIYTGNAGNTSVSVLYVVKWKNLLTVADYT